MATVEKPLPMEVDPKKAEEKKEEEKSDLVSFGVYVFFVKSSHTKHYSQNTILNSVLKCNKYFIMLQDVFHKLHLNFFILRIFKFFVIIRLTMLT